MCVCVLVYVCISCVTEGLVALFIPGSNLYVFVGEIIVCASCH